MVVSAPRRGAVAALVSSPPRALAMTFLVGVAISVQAYVNGHLGRELGSAPVAAAINNLVGLLAIVPLALATGALRRGRGRLASGPRAPAWYFLGGLLGATLVLVSAVAAPEVGVALLTVALVCGSTAGSLVVDAAGIAPAGRRRVTPPRLAGVLLAIAATVIGALGARGDLQPVLLGCAVLAGGATAVQQAANGQLARASGEPLVASLVNFAVGLAALGAIALVAVVVAAPDGAPDDPLLYVGGLLGFFVVVVLAATVQTLGVLRAGLAVVAGQTLGGLLMDAIAPAPGEAVTAGTVAGVLLTIAAVAISGAARIFPPARRER